MALAFIENQSGTQALATTITANYSAVNQGELLTAHLYTKSDSSPANPSGWTTDVEVVNGTNLDYLRICSKIAGAGEPTAVTFTGLAGDLGVLGIFRFSGPANPAIDAVASSAFATGVTSKTSGATVATSQSDEVSVVAYGIRNVAVTSPSLSNGFNLKNFVADTNISVATLIDGYFIETAAGTKESTASWTTAADPMGAIATYKAAGVAIQLEEEPEWIQTVRPA